MPTLHQKRFLTHNSIEVGWSLAGETPTIQQVVSRITQQPPEKEGEKESKYVCISGSHNPLSISTHIFFLHSTPLSSFLCYTLSFPLNISLFTTLKTKNNPSLLFWFYFKGCIHLLWSECFEDRHIFVAVTL